MTVRKHRLAAALLVLSFTSCQERLADGEPIEGRRLCTKVNAARVYDEQGDPAGMVQGPEGGNSTICLCLTLDEFGSGAYDDYFNDRALATCIEDATRMGYPEANDCAYWYEQGQWIEMIRVYPEDEHVRCDPDGESEPLGCSVR
ncbi:hypothetical protein ACNOYE_02985 [Nannocystaceae bacterium ST9]